MSQSSPSSALAAVRQISAVELKGLMDSGSVVELFDVRTLAEWNLTHIQGARLVDEETIAYIHALDRETPLAFVCHHGFRSHAAAQHFASLGFRSVYNVAGGIDAWSQTVDSAIPRY